MQARTSEYSYVKDPLEVDNQTAVIDYTSTGKVDSFEIIDPGDNYQVGDKISLSLEPDSEILETVRINLIHGREVDSVSYSTYEENDIEIIQINSSQYVGVCSELHQFNDSDVVRLSGFSTNISNKIEKDLFKLNTISENYALKTPSIMLHKLEVLLTSEYSVILDSPH